ncbi:MAG: hypothetical protein ACE5I3_13635 [Phycisphaerae bacterium]
MKTIITKYVGECRKCGANMPVGSRAMHERRVGMFCPGCAPTDPDEIRRHKQEAADRRTDQYDEWAEKREAEAMAQLNSQQDLRHDWAFITQPGHIPARARMNQADETAYRSLEKAAEFRAKAKRLRKVRVAGDKEREREAKREAVRAWLKVGQIVDTSMYGRGKVAKINKKTATIEGTGQSGTYRVNVDLSWLSPTG